METDTSKDMTEKPAQKIMYVRSEAWALGCM